MDAFVGAAPHKPSIADFLGRGNELLTRSGGLIAIAYFALRSITAAMRGSPPSM
jgi:hypothetical protein